MGSSSGATLVASVALCANVPIPAPKDQWLSYMSSKSSLREQTNFVTGGGCSGFQYGFSFEEEQDEEDTVVEKGGMKLLVDPMSYQYLVGATIVYEEGLQGSQFVVRNPNASSTCGCGSSFSI